MSYFKTKHTFNGYTNFALSHVIFLPTKSNVKRK